MCRHAGAEQAGQGKPDFLSVLSPLPGVERRRKVLASAPAVVGSVKGFDRLATECGCIAAYCLLMPSVIPGHLHWRYAGRILSKSQLSIKMIQFKAYRIDVNENQVTRSLQNFTTDDLPDGDVLIRVSCSSLNYKDALSANGHRGITRDYPHTPGIDAAGTVVSDRSGQFSDGDPVLVTGFDLGMNTWGGFSEYIRVPVTWVMAKPEGLSLEDSMRLGTAGITAGYCVEQLLINGLSGHEASVLVTGATGGVGSIAVHLLATLGYQVTASTGKKSEHNWLKQLGAADIIDRSMLSEPTRKALLEASYDAAIDTVGQDTLVNVVKQLKFGGSVAACGIVGGTSLPLDIYPFILRGINILGVASADAPLTARQRVLAKFVTLWKLPMLQSMCDEITLDDLDEHIDRMLSGNARRRTLVKVA